MTFETVETLIVGAGQAGLAMSHHLTQRGRPHLVLERRRIAERWRSERWDTLVANGPAWHDRFPAQLFPGDPDAFPTRDAVVGYMEEFARRSAAPIRCGTEVTALRLDGTRFRAETPQGAVLSDNVVAATGPFQRPLLPALVPPSAGLLQLHSAHYRNPAQLPAGAVLVVGAGSSGAQIADELVAAGRQVFLSVGPHARPPRRYRGRDYCWWLGVLGKWDLPPPGPDAQHVTLAVSGAGGGRTVDFRRLAARGAVLLGRAEASDAGIMRFAPDLAANLAAGDADYHAVLDEADAYAAREGLDLPEEPEARHAAPDPACLAEPILSLDLAAAGIAAIVWATGYALDFGWLELDVLDAAGRVRHDGGATPIPGLYVLGLPWLTNRSSSFIWGVWRDAERLAAQIDARMHATRASAA